MTLHHSLRRIVHGIFVSHGRNLTLAQRSGGLLHPLLHAGHLVEARQRDRLNKTGLGPRQARVLSALDHIGETHQKTLAAGFDITPASMSSMCDRLVAAGLIERQVDPNEKRAFLIHLTPEGKSKVQDVRVAWSEIDEIIINAIGQEAAESLAGLSGDLRDHLGGAIPPAVLYRKKDS